MPDRAAQPCAELLQSIFRSREARGFIESIVGSGRGVPIVIKRIAVEGVASRSRHRVYEARSPTVDRGVGTHRDLKLLDRVLSVQVRDTVAAYNVGKVVAGRIRSVHSEGVGTIAIRVSRVFTALLPGNAHQAGVAVVA